MNKTFRIFLQNGLTADVIAAKVELRAWREGDPQIGEAFWAITTDDGTLVAAFKAETVIGVHGELGI